MELAELQDQEVGDGTTSVVIVAAELLKRANELVRNKIHPTSIIGGYRIAMREVCPPHHFLLADGALLLRTLCSGQVHSVRLHLHSHWCLCLQACKYIEEHLAIDTASLGKETLLNAAKTAMSSKIVDSESDFFAHMVVDAVLVRSSPLACLKLLPTAHWCLAAHCFQTAITSPSIYCAPVIVHIWRGCDGRWSKSLTCVPVHLQSVKTTGSNGKTVYPVKAINVLKAHGKSAKESALLNGYALNMGRASQGMPKRVASAKIACLDMNLQKARMHMGIQVHTLRTP